jgi:hypothetical protein
MTIFTSCRFNMPNSACYAALLQWQKALEDALMCVAKDGTFLKGYFRLANAQAALNLYDDAETTCKAALAKEPGKQYCRTWFNCLLIFLTLRLCLLESNPVLRSCAQETSKRRSYWVLFGRNDLGPKRKGHRGRSWMKRRSKRYGANERTCS